MTIIYCCTQIILRRIFDMSVVLRTFTENKSVLKHKTIYYCCTFECDCSNQNVVIPLPRLHEAAADCEQHIDGFTDQ